MNNVLHAIRTENQSAAVSLQKLEARIEANQDYLSKVKIDFSIFLEFFCFLIIDRSKNVNHVN
jgi:hypothetical protein